MKTGVVTQAAATTTVIDVAAPGDGTAGAVPTGAVPTGEVPAGAVPAGEAAVRAAFAAYEAALMVNDVETMNEFFWSSGEVVRFGIADEQWGAGEVRRWRASAAPIPSGRHLGRTRVTMLGPDTAIVTTLITYPGREGHGRQSQTWFRLEEGWRIVHAHVSEIGSEVVSEIGSEIGSVVGSETVSGVVSEIGSETVSEVGADRQIGDRR